MNTAVIGHQFLNEVEERRRVNLRALVAQHGLSNIGRKLELKNPSYVGHLTAGRKRITGDAAAKIEKALELPAGWLSADRSASKSVTAGATVALDTGLLARVLFAVRDAVGETAIPRKKEAEIVNLVYIRAQEQGKVDAQYVEQLVQLARQ